MKKLYVLIVLCIMTLTLTGCYPAPPVPEKTTIPQETIEKSWTWARKIVSEKTNILKLIQTRPDDMTELLQDLKDAGEPSEKFKKAGYDDLSEVLFDISTISSQLSLYRDTHDAKYFSEATRLFNECDKILKRNGR